MKHKKLFAAALALTLATAPMLGCGDSNRSGEQTPSNTVTVNDFERFDTCFSPMRAANYFGVVTMNKDAKYVKSGEASARLRPMGDWYEAPNAKPTLRIPFNMKLKGEDYGNFSKVVMLTAEVYNASAFDVTCRVYLSYTGGYTTAKEVTLKAGAWTRIAYSIDRALLAITGDITKITDLNLEFPVVAKDGDIPDLYLDDVKLITTQDDFKQIEMNFTDNKLLTFEENWEMLVLPKTSGNGIFDPTLSLNTDPTYSRTGNSLKVDFIGNDGSVTDYAYAGFYLPRAVLKESGFDTKVGTDTFAFDVYNAGPGNQRLMVAMTNDAGRVFFKYIYIQAPPNEWTTVEYSFTELDRGWPDNLKDGQQKGDGATAAGGGTAKVASIYIHWDYYQTAAGNRTLYFDNFRYGEKVD